MTTFASRQTAREALVVDLVATSVFTAVHDHIPQTIGGESPVCTVSAAPSSLDVLVNAPNNGIAFFVVVWALRLDEGESIDRSAAAEDDIDSVAVAVKGVIELFDNGVAPRPSEPDYHTLDGLQYRIETYFVEIEHYET